MKIDSIIFDMDGVLIDVRNSYRVAIKKTVNFLLGQKKLSAKVTQREVEMIKDLPGFNNDWDATYALIILMLDAIGKRKINKMAITLQPKDRENILYEEGKYIFQTYYLGSRLFKKIEGYNAPLNVIRGLIWQEKCLVSKKFLEKLLDVKLKLGIVTGRPRKEALFAIDNFKLQSFFPERNIVALEDAAKEKPAPDPLLAAKKRMKVLRPIYVGDTVNDVLAAKKAKMPCVFVGKRKIGDFQITAVNKLMEVLL